MTSTQSYTLAPILLLHASSNSNRPFRFIYSRILPLVYSHASYNHQAARSNCPRESELLDAMTALLARSQRNSLSTERIGMNSDSPSNSQHFASCRSQLATQRNFALLGCQCTIRADRKGREMPERDDVLGVGELIKRRSSVPLVLAQFVPILGPCRSTPE